ncbi:Flp family type IVb pilin [Methylopila sp. M107]|uniref:Flp family type IVb pilin n=1 Tax=Methylopila sp. M107 TaxID=1101190 RepID=UPI00035DCAD0|nr:Flp family type IVb pilin [Methylopila sp. M107]
MTLISRFKADQSGATAIEYGLIAVGIAIAIIFVTKGIGSNLNVAFKKVQTGLN